MESLDQLNSKWISISKLIAAGTKVPSLEELGMKQLPREPLHIGEFIGYRVWEYHKVLGEPLLRSWVQPTFWEPGIPMTDMTYMETNASVYSDMGPITDFNERGVWGYKEKETCMKQFPVSLNNAMVAPLVWGSVFMWGTIIEHTLGWRAQYARIRTIESYDPESHEIDIDFLRKKYKV